jgi:hypothetical protein
LRQLEHVTDEMSAITGRPAALELEEWGAMADQHRDRVQKWTLPYRKRRARAARHPVHDFLFRYYRYSMGKLEEWHPGIDEPLKDSPQAREQFSESPYRLHDGVIQRDCRSLEDKDRGRMEWTRDLLKATAARMPHFGCFGMHEWAMIYRGDDVRHREAVPLRMPQESIDRFVESRPIACTHFDAFRFFTADARPLNRVQPSPTNRDELEQPGCIHANMDLYKRAYRSMPWIGSELLWETFQLALRLRSLDMRASPYDLRSLGYDPVPVETPEGRAQYQQEQRTLAKKAGEVRNKLIHALGAVLSRADGGPTRNT